MNFLHLTFVDILDIFLLTVLLYYVYKLVKGTVAVNIFIGIVIFYLFWQLTRVLEMEMLSGILGEFVKVGFIAMIVVFQQEIRKFLLMVGSAQFTGKNILMFPWRLLKPKDDQVNTDVDSIINACRRMGESKTGALIIIRRRNSLDFVKSTGDIMNIELNIPIIESIFYKNSTLHDGAMIIEDNHITATRAILPVSNSREIPLRYGLRHRAAIGITEKTDALALVVSEETGKTSYIHDGEFIYYEGYHQLIDKIKQDLV